MYTQYPILCKNSTKNVMFKLRNKDMKIRQRKSAAVKLTSFLYVFGKQADNLFSNGNHTQNKQTLNKKLYKNKVNLIIRKHRTRK